MGKALTDKKKEDKEDILPKKEEKRRKSWKRRKKEELDTLQYNSCNQILHVFPPVRKNDIWEVAMDQDKLPGVFLFFFFYLKI